MKEKLFGLTTLACALAVLLSAGCEVSTYDALTGQAVIRIGDNSPARSLVPDTAPVFTKYELIFTADGRDTIYRTLETSSDRTAINGSGYAIELEEAAWTVEASAFVQGTGGSFMEAARGTTSLMVNSANRNPSALITLNPLPMDGEGKGIFIWNLNLSGVSGGSVSATGTITSVVDGISREGIELLGLTGSKELSAGYYLLKFTLDKEGKKAGVYCAVHIYPGLTTKAEGAEFTFTNEDFQDVKYISGTVRISGVPGGRTVEWVKIRPYQDPATTIPLGEETYAQGVTATQSGTWFLTVPADVTDISFKVTIWVTGYTREYTEVIWGSVIVSGRYLPAYLPSNGRNDIFLSVTYGEATHRITFEKGVSCIIDDLQNPVGEIEGDPPLFTYVSDNQEITLPGQGDMRPPAGQQFNGWRTGGTTYPAGARFNVTAETYFTAQWGLSTRYIVSPACVTSGGVVRNYDIMYKYYDPDAEYDYWYLYLGQVKNVPLLFRDTIDYDGSSTFTYSMSESFEQSQGFQSTITDTISTTTHQETSTATSNTFNVGISLGGENAKAKISGGYSHTWGRTTTNGRSDTVEHTSQYTTDTRWAKTTTTTRTYTLSPSDSPSGRYRLVLLGTIDVFVGLRKKRTSDDEPYQFVYDAFVNNNPTETRVVVDYVPLGGSFPNIDASSLLQLDPAWLPSLPDDDIAPPEDWLIQDATSDQIIQIPDDKSVALIRGTGGVRVITKINVDPRSTDLRIIIKNLRLLAPDRSPGINIADTSGTITVEVRGTNSITGGRGADGLASTTTIDGNGKLGWAAINCNGSGSIVIDSTDGTLTLTGGNGGNGGNSADGRNGGDGGTGITASAGVVIEGGTGNVNITGGNGGNGSTSTTRNGNGGTGGNGGHGIYCAIGTVQLKNVTVSGGNGGNGGNGAYDGNWFTGYNTDGGDSGSGGSAVAAKAPPIDLGGYTWTGGTIGTRGLQGNNDPRAGSLNSVNGSDFKDLDNL